MTRERNKWSFTLAAVVVAGLALGSGTAKADDHEGPNKGNVSVDVGLGLASQYIFRGIPQENQGLIFQPSIEVGMGLTDNTSLSFGTWNSFHSNHSAAAASPATHYENDLYIGVSHALNEQWSASATYTAYTAPNGSFTTVEEIAFGVEYADEFGLNPHATLAFEVQNSAMGPNEGIYLELGIAPELSLIEAEDNPVTFSIPMVAGFSIDDYYDATTTNDDGWGYFDIGIDAAMPLGSIPAEYGSWELSAGLHVIFLNDNPAAAGAGVTGGSKDAVYVTVGLGISY